MACPRHDQCPCPEDLREGLPGIIGPRQCQGPQPEEMDHMSITGSLRQGLAADVAALGLPPGPARPAMVSEAQLASLPSAAQRYLRFMGVVGRPADWSFLAHLTGRFRLRRGLPWLRCEAWQ